MNTVAQAFQCFLALLHSAPECAGVDLVVTQLAAQFAVISGARVVGVYREQDHEQLRAAARLLLAVGLELRFRPVRRRPGLWFILLRPQAASPDRDEPLDMAAAA